MVNLSDSIIIVDFFSTYHKKYSQFVYPTELGSDEESGKDWSDLEREAAEDDAHHDDGSFLQKKKPTHDRRDKHKSSKHHR